MKRVAWSLLMLLVLSTPSLGQTPIKGINLAWLNHLYGCDFGHSPEHPEYGVLFNRDELDRQFADIESLRLTVVRIFVFEDLEGLEFDAKGYVKGVDPALIENFKTATGLAARHHLSLYLCMTNNVEQTCRKLGKRNFVRDLRARQAYFLNALKPFVIAMRGRAVFAIDLINEPEYDPMADYPPEVVHSFLGDGAYVVHRADPRRKVSVGGSRVECLPNYIGTGLDFYDFHRYSTEGELPAVWELGMDRPVLLGEFSAEDKDAWDDDKLCSAVTKFLENVKNKGYAGALYWCYGGPENKPSCMDLTRGNGNRELRPVAYVLRDFRLTNARPRRRR